MDGNGGKKNDGKQNGREEDAVVLQHYQCGYLHKIIQCTLIYNDYSHCFFRALLGLDVCVQTPVQLNLFGDLGQKCITLTLLKSAYIYIDLHIKYRLS